MEIMLHFAMEDQWYWWPAFTKSLFVSVFPFENMPKFTWLLYEKWGKTHKLRADYRIPYQVKFCALFSRYTVHVVVSTVLLNVLIDVHMKKSTLTVEQNANKVCHVWRFTCGLVLNISDQQYLSMK